MSTKEQLIRSGLAKLTDEEKNALGLTVTSLTKRTDIWGEAPPGIDPEAWRQWAEYKGRSVKKNTVTMVRKKLQLWPMHKQLEAVEHSIACGYKGLFLPRNADLSIKGALDEAQESRPEGQSHVTSKDLFVR